MKRLLCIVSSLNIGGAETFLMKLYREFNTDKYQMDFIVNDNGYYDNEVYERGGKIFTIPLRTKHPLKSFDDIRRIVKEHQYSNVIKMCDTSIGVTDLLAAKFGGAKHIGVRSCNSSSYGSTMRDALIVILRPLFNSISDFKISPSSLAAEYTFGKKAVESGKVNLLHNAIDFYDYDYDMEGASHIREEFTLDRKKVIGHVGRFTNQKNHKFLLEIFNAIHHKDKNSVLLLVGNGELEEEIKTLVSDYGLAGDVILTGVRSDVQQLLSAMDVFVLPSFFEGMPNTVIEAQANGLPCVISDTITQEANITGLVTFLPLENSEAWAECALKLCEHTIRKLTLADFKKSGYEISSVVKEFVDLCFK